MEAGLDFRWEVGGGGRDLNLAWGGGGGGLNCLGGPHNNSIFLRHLNIILLRPLLLLPLAQLHRYCCMIIASQPKISLRYLTAHPGLSSRKCPQNPKCHKTKNKDKLK